MNGPPRITPIQLEHGKPTTINFNVPVKFKIVFALGTYIEGIIPPNSGLTVCSHGDITEFSIIVDDESVKKPGLVQPPDEGPDPGTGAAS
jgi:hypothetical protein